MANDVEMTNRNVRTTQSSRQRPEEGSRESEQQQRLARNGATSPPFDRYDVITNCFWNILASGSNDERANSTLWSQILAARWPTEPFPARSPLGSSCRPLNDIVAADALSPAIRGVRVLCAQSDDIRKTDRSSDSTDFAGVLPPKVSANKLPVPNSRTATRTAPWRPFVDEDDDQASGNESAPTRSRDGVDAATSARFQEPTCTEDVKCGRRIVPIGLFLRRGNHIDDLVEREMAQPGRQMTKPQNQARPAADRSDLDVAEMHKPKLAKITAVEKLAGKLRQATQPNNSDCRNDRRQLLDGRHQDDHSNYAPPSRQVLRPAWYDVISESCHRRIQLQQSSNCHFLPTFAPWRQGLSSSDASPNSLSPSSSPIHQNKQLAIAGLLLSPDFTENPSAVNGITTSSSASSSGSSGRWSVGRSPPTPFHATTTEKSPLTCTYCDKVYISAGALKMHIRTHTLPCRCPHCGKAFSRLWLLRGHLRTHTGERPFHCPDPDCRRAFADRSNLRAHLRTHAFADPGCGGDGRTTGNRPRRYECSVCGKTFSRMSLLARHEMSAGCRRVGTEREQRK